MSETAHDECAQFVRSALRERPLFADEVIARAAEEQRPFTAGMIMESIWHLYGADALQFTDDDRLQIPKDSPK